MYKAIVAAAVPVLANLTEFGQTPCMTQQLADVGIDMALYLLFAFRAMNKAALNVYHDWTQGTQAAVVDTSKRA